MDITWLLEPEVFQGDLDEFQDTLDRLKVKQVICKFGTPYEDYLPLFSEKNCVVFHGSLQFAKLIRRKAAWAPNLFCNLPQFECIYYYPRFREHLLNNDCRFMPFGDLLRRKDSLFDKIGDGKELFIRPSNGDKRFCGTVVKRESWQYEIHDAGARTALEDLVIVGAVFDVVNEWRLVVVEGVIVASTQYRKDRKICRICGSPDNILEYGRQVLKDVGYLFEPDPAWTLDICETADGAIKVMEVGSFSCSGLYASEPEPIIEAINRIVVGPKS